MTRHSPPADAMPLGPSFVDAATHPETRGIELVGVGERRGHPRELFWVWAAPNISVLNFTFGATLILLGLSLGQAAAVTLASNALWFFTGYIASSGPAAGTAGSVISRAMYGVVGNKLIIALTGWLLSAVFLAINWLASSFMGAELIARAGWTDPTAVPIIVTVGVSVLTVLVAVYGHGLIVRTYSAVTLALLAIFLAATAYMAPSINWGYSPEAPLSGVALWSSLTIGFTILAATPLSYINSPDLARYLPHGTSRWRIAAATALGGALPCVFFTIVGALLATGIDAVAIASGLESALLDPLPGWLVPLFVIGVVVNTVALNGMTTYSASMAMQSIGFPLRRIPAAVVVGILGTALTIYLVLSASMLDAVNLLLQVVVVVVGPAMAVYVTDVSIRRNRYAGEDLFDDSPQGRFWYTAGWSVPGMAAIVVGGVVATLCLTTEDWAGPIAEALDYVDLSVPGGMITAAVVYVVLIRTPLGHRTAR
jgi:NCS1 family nucleobase:cation symporter-1